MISPAVVVAVVLLSPGCRPAAYKLLYMEPRLEELMGGDTDNLSLDASP